MLKALRLSGKAGEPGASVRPGTGGVRRGLPSSTRSGGHVHWFRRSGDDPFSSAALYACRCGQVRAAF